MDCSLLGSSVHGILQARILEWVAMPSSKGSSQTRDQTRVSCVSCSGSKCSRWKANNKVPGRSPLTVLQDDNSPGTLTPRQVKGKRVKAVTRKPRVKIGAFSPPGLRPPEQPPALPHLAQCLLQGKQPSLSENFRELKEGAILGTGRPLKTGGRAWEQGQGHDKENQHFPLVES